MKISWKWMNELLDLSELRDASGLADCLTARGLEVEAMHRLDAGFEKVITVQILEKKPHPQADRLSLCQVSAGTGSEPLEIVCGATNMKAGDKVALAQIGALLPNRVRIERSKIRGVVSNGMLCSEEELKFKEHSEGILILPQDTPIGVPLAKIFGLDDVILDLKLYPNRGDCMSHFGIAREVVSALGRTETLKLPSKKIPTLNFVGDSAYSLKLDAGEWAPQFWACLIEDVRIGPSPKWLASRLETLGIRPINNVVDATNYLLLELGHPMHAYDADRLQGKEIHVRVAKPNEKLPLLDGQTITLDGFELVIADGAQAERPIGLAGVMGGGNTEVTSQTTRVLLECAEFSPVLTRRAAQRHLRRTEAAHRFERGVDPMGLERAISRLAQKITELAAGEIRGMTSTVLPSRDPAKNFRKQEVTVKPVWINTFLGTRYSEEEIEKVLRGQLCEISKLEGASWKVSVPSHRLDLNLPEDIAEEVACGKGYGTIPSAIPVLTSEPAAVGADPAYSNWLKIEQVKDALVGLGCLETVNYSFMSEAWLKLFGMKSEVRLLNPLSEEMEYLVPSLIPGLIKNALDNERHHFGSERLSIRLFEVRPVFKAAGEIRATSETETGVLEEWKIALLLSGPRFAGGLRLERGELDFFDLKAVVESLAASLGTRGVRFRERSAAAQAARPGVSDSSGVATGVAGAGSGVELFHPGQSVEILAGNAVAGRMGLFHPRLHRSLKGRSLWWVAELDLGVLLKMSPAVTEARGFKPWPPFPTMERDFALLVKKSVRAEQITQLALRAGKPLAKSAQVFDIYQGSQVLEGMTSVAVRVIFFNESRSLEESETEAACAKILEVWKKELGAELRS